MLTVIKSPSGVSSCLNGLPKPEPFATLSVLFSETEVKRFDIPCHGSKSRFSAVLCYFCDLLHKKHKRFLNSEILGFQTCESALFH